MHMSCLVAFVLIQVFQKRELKLGLVSRSSLANSLLWVARHEMYIAVGAVFNVL